MKTTQLAPLAHTQPIMISAGKQDVFSYPNAPEILDFRDRLLQTLEEAAPGTVVPVSFEGIILNGSCHAEVLGTALQKIVQGHFSQRFLVAHDPDGHNDWDADAALKKESRRLDRKLVCVWYGPAGTPNLIGEVDPQVQATFDFVFECYQSGSPATARALAKVASIKIQAASNRMRKAASLGLLYRAEEEPIRGGGTQYVYMPVS